MTEQEEKFWEVLSTFKKEGILPHIVVIGSWAEYLYQYLFDESYQYNLKTRDADFFVPNIRKPDKSVSVFSIMENCGFTVKRDNYTGVCKFNYLELLEVEFLTRSLGSHASGNYQIPSLGVTSEGLRSLNIFENHIITVNANGMDIPVPDPAVFIIQKILTNPTRTPAYKREKDIASVRNLMETLVKDDIYKKSFRNMMDSLTKKQKKLFESVSKEYHLNFENFYHFSPEELKELKPFLIGKASKEMENKDKNIVSPGE